MSKIKKIKKTNNKQKKWNLVLINNVTYQRETLTEWPIRLPLRRYCTFYQKLACYVLSLKIINNFFEKNR